MNRNLPTLTPEITEAFAPQVLEVIRNSLAPTANDHEFLLFAHKAASYGLDPFKNEIFFIKYGSQARIQFAAEAYIAKAREKEGFQPPDTQVVCENDEFKARKVKREDGSDDWEILLHEVSFPRGKIIGAYSIAYREGFRPVTEFVDKDHISHMYTGQNKDNWNKWEPDMIGKHAQQRALKKQYGLSFEDVTIPSNDAPQPTAQGRKDITPNQEHIEPPTKQPAPTRDEELRNEINARLKQLGITTKEAMQEYLNKNAPNINPATATEAEMVGLIELLDMNIEMLASQPQNNDDDLLE